MVELAQADTHRPTLDFVDRVHDIASRLRTVLINTTELKNFANDPEMLVDLQYDVAASYNNSPHLRFTWLESIAKIHANRGSWSEAAMAVIHCATIVAQQLQHKRGSIVAGVGVQPLLQVSSNVAVEQSQSPASPTPQAQLGPAFSDAGFLHVLAVAIRFLKEAKRFELVPHLYNIFLPMLERQRNYPRLAQVMEDLHCCYSHILELERTKRRHLGRYYRVAFFGTYFGRLDGKEYIYKEPDVCF